MKSATNQTACDHAEYYQNKVSNESKIETGTKRNWENTQSSNIAEDQNLLEDFREDKKHKNIESDRYNSKQISDETFIHVEDSKTKANPVVRDYVEDSENIIAKSTGSQSTDDSQDNAEQDETKLPASPNSVAESEPAAKKPALPPYNSLWPNYLHQLIHFITNEYGDDWEPVMDRIRTYPEEIAGIGPLKEQNPLHMACIRFAPVQVVQAMLELCPEAAKKQNTCLETPLHLASITACEEVQVLLIRSAPETAGLVDQYGDTPLHIAIRQGATPQLVELLIAAAPEAISVKNNLGETPFGLLRRSYLNAEKLQDIYSVPKGADDAYDEEEEEQVEYQNDWEILVLFLRFSYYTWDEAVLRQSFLLDGTSRSSQFEWMLHAAAATPSCPRDILRFLCRLFPNAALHRDENGFTPLHYACFHSIVDEPLELDENEDRFRSPIESADSETNHDDGREAPESITLSAGADTEFFQRQIFDNQEENQDGDSKQSNQSALEILLNANPASASCVDSQGRLPLGHALIAGKPWKLVRRIIICSAHSLESRDIITGLYMFQLAAIHSRDLETVYNIVRALPNSISSLFKKRNGTIEPFPSSCPMYHSCKKNAHETGSPRRFQ